TVELEPGNAKSRANYGMSLFLLEDLPGAAAQYEKAVELDPKLAQAYGALGNIYLQQRRFAEAKKVTLTALELLPPGDPLRPTALEQLRECERLLGQEPK